MAKNPRLDKPSQEITKIAGTNANFLAQYQDDTSLQAMEQFMIVPRLKIIQAMTATDLKTQFGEGSVIVRPGDTLVWKFPEDPPFIFNPHFFYTEYCEWSDRRDNENPAIRRRTFDPTHEIARRSQDKNLRFKVYEGDEKLDPQKQKKIRYVQHFVWLGQIYGDHALADTCVAMSMEKGEHTQGRNFISAIQMRRMEVGGEGTPTERVRVPLWAQLWALKPALRESESNKWFGFDFSPPDRTIILPEEADACRAGHLKLSKLHEENKIRVDHGDNDQGGEDDGSRAARAADAAASGKY